MCVFKGCVHLLFVEIKTIGTHFVCAFYFYFFCMNAHLCLRTLIGCMAIETLTLF